ncbi:unnamed protein product, partial [Phaeothamnion confervicola]
MSFDAAYAAADDPWSFTSSAYEMDKYALTISSLARERYARCFEPACSIGALTRRLAERADEVVACDGSPIAVDRARARLADAPHVELVAAAIPEWWPTGTFDLIVLSELGYYWDSAGWSDIVGRCAQSLSADGEVIAVHWLGSSADHVQNGRTVHQELLAVFGPSDLHIER